MAHRAGKFQADGAGSKGPMGTSSERLSNRVGSGLTGGDSLE
jgi:hypothetical protein